METKVSFFLFRRHFFLGVLATAATAAEEERVGVKLMRV